MRIRSWLDTCSSASCATAIHQSTISTSSAKRPLASDTSSSSESTPSSSSSSSSTSNSSNSSLQSSLSIQTHPSVPSLQNLIPSDSDSESSSSTHALISYDVVSQHCLSSLSRQNPITSLALHSNLLYAASSHEINVYDRHTLANLDAFNGHDSSSGSTKSVSFFHDLVLTSHQDSKIRIWKLQNPNNNNNKTHRIVASLPTVTDRLRRFLLPNNYVTIRRHKKLLWIQHADAVTDLAVNADASTIYSVSWDKTLKIWRACDFRCVESVKAHEDAVNAVVVSRDGTVYTGSADKRIRVWAKPDGSKSHVLIATLEKHKSAVNALALNDVGSVLFSGACDRSILVWEREESANHMVVRGALRGHERAILCLINVQDLLLSGSADRTVRIWRQVGGGDGGGGRYCCLSVLAGHEKPVKCVAAVVDSDGENGDVSVFSGSLDGEIRVWRVSMKKKKTTTTAECGRSG